MKAVLERMEYNWWNFHIKMMDESKIVREILPHFQSAWEMREEAMPYLVLSLLGFPLGVILGILAAVAN